MLRELVVPREELRDLGDAPHVLRVRGVVEAEVAVQPLADDVAVEPVGGAVGGEKTATSTLLVMGCENKVALVFTEISNPSSCSASRVSRRCTSRQARSLTRLCRCSQACTAYLSLRRIRPTVAAAPAAQGVRGA